MQIGDARVSTDHQDTAAQVAALKSAGCERISARLFKIYPATVSRPLAREPGSSSRKATYAK